MDRRHLLVIAATLLALACAAPSLRAQSEDGGADPPNPPNDSSPNKRIKTQGKNFSPQKEIAKRAVAPPNPPNDFPPNKRIKTQGKDFSPQKEIAERAVAPPNPPNDFPPNKRIKTQGKDVPPQKEITERAVAPPNPPNGGDARERVERRPDRKKEPGSARERMRERFENLSPEQQERIRQKREQFQKGNGQQGSYQNVGMHERAKLRQQMRDMSPEERREFLRQKFQEHQQGGRTNGSDSPRERFQQRRDQREGGQRPAREGQQRDRQMGGSFLLQDERFKQMLPLANLPENRLDEALQKWPRYQKLDPQRQERMKERISQFRSRMRDEARRASSELGINVPQERMGDFAQAYWKKRSEIEKRLQEKLEPMRQEMMQQARDELAREFEASPQESNDSKP